MCLALAAREGGEKEKTAVAAPPGWRLYLLDQDTRNRKLEQREAESSDTPRVKNATSGAANVARACSAVQPCPRNAIRIAELRLRRFGAPEVSIKLPCIIESIPRIVDAFATGVKVEVKVGQSIHWEIERDQCYNTKCPGSNKTAINVLPISELIQAAFVCLLQTELPCRCCGPGRIAILLSASRILDHMIKYPASAEQFD